MTNRGQQRVSSRSGSLGAVLRALVTLGAIAVAIALVVGAWDDTGAATGVVSMRIFLVGWAIAAVVLVGSPFADLAHGRGSSAVLLTARHVAMGLVIGLAIGTTDWTTLRLAGWWQLWWTVPLLLVYTSLLTTLRRSPRTRP